MYNDEHFAHPCLPLSTHRIAESIQRLHAHRALHDDNENNSSNNRALLPSFVQADVVT